VKLHGPNDPPQQVNNSPLPSPIVASMIENTASSIEEQGDDETETDI
jgi:hypothetical protein